MKFKWLGAIVALPLLCLVPAAPAMATWRRAESPHFIVYGNLPENMLRQRILKLEDFDHLMRIIMAVTDAAAPNKLNVYLVRGHDDLNLIHPVPAGVGGYYMATAEGIAALVDENTPASGDEVLLHEYAHHFMMQYRPNAYPAWYIEGYAEYFMTANFTPRRIDIGNFSPGRAYSIVAGQWLPMERVLNGEPQALGPEAMAQYYAQAWLTVHYFYSTAERQTALARYLLALRGDHPEDALRTATGMDAAAFTAELHRYIGHGEITYRRMTRAEPVPPPVTVTVLPPGADDLMLYAAALGLGLDEELGRAYLPRIRAAAARREGDSFAQRVLAHAELLFGDMAAADRLLDALLQANANDAELLYLKGRRFQLAAERGEDPEANARRARDWFGRAHQADPNHYQTLYRYAQNQRQNGAFLSENNINVLLLAHQLAPQVSEITMNAASALLARRDYAEAAVLLRPLASDPHNRALAQAARRMLDEATSHLAEHAPAAPARTSPASPPPH